eukprot:GHRQ01008162.1.p1 GENE.GHRQ01008162.1~~GHRQ01008162.1.p1  ORF type:complete len:623 (+),score=334.69 GHRQ01008162.1:65-1933(+)
MRLCVPPASCQPCLAAAKPFPASLSGSHRPTFASPASSPGLAKLFRGHVAELLRHPSGADVLDDLYSVCPPACRNTLCAELYGREFTLFGGVSAQSEGISRLSQLLAGVDAKKRQAVVGSLYKGLAPVLEKALLHPAMTHRLLRELLAEAPGSVVADAVDTLAAAGGNALKLVHTHDGAAAFCMALAYGTPKDRKRLLKGMKGFVWQTAENEWGHAAVATALSVVDDTALTGKTLLPELKSKVDEWVTNKHAVRVLLQLLAPDNHRYLPQATRELLHPPAKSMMVSAAAAASAAGGSGGSAAAGIDDDDEVMDEDAADEPPREKPSKKQAPDDSAEPASEVAGGITSSQLVERQLGESRKDPMQRRKELLSAGGKDSLATVLLALCAEQAGQLLCSQVSADVVVEVARGAAGGLLWELQQQGVEAVHAALVQQVAADCSRVAGVAKPAAAGKQHDRKKGKAAAADAGAGEQYAAEQQQVQEPLLTQFFASRALRRLLLAGGSDGADGAGARAFAQQLWKQGLQGQCQQLVGSHAEKVLAGLLHCGEETVQQQAAAELQPLVGDVKAWAAKFWGPAGAEEQQHSKTKEKKKARGRTQNQQQQQQQQQQNGTRAPSKKNKQQQQ